MRARRRRFLMLMGSCVTLCVLAWQEMGATPRILKRWDRRFGGAGNDWMTCGIKTSDGGTLLGGTSLSGMGGDKSEESRGNEDWWVVKTDSNGKKQWDRRFGGAKTDYLTAVIEATNGTYLLVGFSSSEQGGDKSQNLRGEVDFWSILLGADGGKIWDRRFGGSLDDIPYCAVQLQNGHFLIAGTSRSPADGDKTEPDWRDGPGSYDIWMVVVDIAGNKVMDKRIGGTERDEARFVWQVEGGDIFIAGRTDSGVSGDKTSEPRGKHDYWLLKLDASRNLVWERAYGGSDADFLTTAVLVADGGFLLGGHSVSGISGDKSQSGWGGNDLWFIRLDQGGNKVWDRTYGGSGAEMWPAACEMPYGGFIIGSKSLSGVSGTKTEPNLGGNDYWVLSISEIGSVLRDKTLGGNAYDEYNAVAFLSGGCAILGGYTYSSANGDVSQSTRGEHDFWIVKVGMDSDGDGLTDGEELIADTDRHDPASYLGFVGMEGVIDAHFRLTWQGGSNVNQVIERTEDIRPMFPRWTTVHEQNAPTEITNSISVSPTEPWEFYRIRAIAR